MKSRRGVRRRQKMAVLPLPEGLIIEILLRLPVKSLLQLKCVCKSWLSFISDPHFAKSHFERDAARTERLLFITTLSYCPVIRSIDFNRPLSDNAAYFPPPKFLPRMIHHLRISGSCRGFLLLNYDGTLCVWNPSTRVHKILYSPPVLPGLVPFLYGIGYDPSTDDYLVVQVSCDLLCLFDRGLLTHVTGVQFFSLRANAWKEIEATHLSYKRMPLSMFDKTFIETETGLFLNGAIHWLALNCDVSKNVTVAFDLTERSFSEIPLPVDFVSPYFGGGFRGYLLGVLGELLSLSVAGQHYSMEIWVMKEYKVQSSWTKTIVVSADRIPAPIGHFFPVCYTKSGDIVGTEDCTVLAKCNDKGLLQEHRSYSYVSYVHHHESYDPFQSHVAVYTESLFSLPCDSDQVGEDH